MTVGTIERQGRRPMPTTSSMAGADSFEGADFPPIS
jgi:hypothetical protein